MSKKNIWGDRAALTWVDRQLHVSKARKRQALTREFLEDLKRAAVDTCQCCHGRLTWDRAWDGRTPVPTYATLDRVSPKLGYAPWNVQIICWLCNTRKSDMSPQDVRNLLRYMETHAPGLS